MADPYRRADDARAEAAELVFPLGSSDRPRKALRALGVFTALLVGYVWLGSRTHPALFLAALAAAFVWGAITGLRALRPDELVVRVAGGEVVFSRRHDPTSARTFSLAAVRDVRLESRTIQRVTPGSEPTGTQFIDTRVGPSVEISRIVVEGERPHALFDEPIAYSLAVDMLGKIRAFLRRHGWVPEDERVRVEEDEEDDDDADDVSVREEARPEGRRR